MNRNKDLTKLLFYVSDLMASIQSYLTSELLDRSGKVDNWSAKDNIFHSLVWSNNRLDMLETIERDENWTDVDYGDFSEINREIYEEHKNKSWDDLQLMIGTTYQRGLAYINRASEETLLEKKEGDERPFWRIVADNFVIHPMLHIWDLLQKSGRDDLMIENFGDDFSNMLRKLDTSEDWLGTIDYNQACLFSLSGNLEKAITKLGKALKLNSGLIDWSKQDSDLDPLRELPEFLELYKQ
jgi:hypothetical protein